MPIMSRYVQLLTLSLAIWPLAKVTGHDLKLPLPAVTEKVSLTDSGIDLGRWQVQQSGNSRMTLSVIGSKPNRPPRLRLHVQPQKAIENPSQTRALLDLKGLDASRYDHLTLSIEGETVASSSELELQLIRKSNTGAKLEETGRFMLGGITGGRRTVEIPLNYFQGISRFDHLSALAIAIPKDAGNLKEGAYLVDDIEFLKTGHEGILSEGALSAEGKRLWAEREGGDIAARPKLKARLAGWPEQLLIEPSALPENEREFLQRLAKDTWRGIDGLTDKIHGLPLDRVSFAKEGVDPKTSLIGDYTNITNIGVYLVAITAAMDLDLINRKDALQRIKVTLNTLDHLENYRGFFFNYYNTTTLERGTNLASFVDSAWLSAGLMIVRQAFPELEWHCSQLINMGNYGLFYDPEQKLMTHGLFMHTGKRSEHHYGILYTEARIGSLIGIGKGEVPQEHWFALARTLPPSADWQSEKPIGYEPRQSGGQQWMAGHYHWHDRDYVPSWGGSQFEALMPLLVLDEMQHAPKSLGANDRTHSLLQRLYATEDLGYPIWGMSPSATADGLGYGEFGVKKLGMGGYPAGVVTSHAAGLALMTEPQEAVKNLRRIAIDYHAYGDFGLYDAINPTTREVGYTYLCLDQSMILIALANHLADHSIQRYFAKDPIIQNVLPMIGREHFFE